MIFVVGFAHSGTTFLCEVLGGAGFDFGPGKHDHMEDVPLRRLLFDVDTRLLKYRRRPDACLDLHEPIVEAFRKAGPADVFKQPSFVHCLSVVLDAGIRPGHVLLTHRDLRTVRESLIVYGRYEKRGARTLELEWMQNEWIRAKAALEKAHIPYGIVRFPRSVDDVDEIPAAMHSAGIHIDYDQRVLLEAAWEKWRQPQRVHFRRD